MIDCYDMDEMLSYGREDIGVQMADAILEARGNALWYTKHGEELRVCTMSTYHINNTINYLKRRKGYSDNIVSQAYVTVMENELKRRSIGRGVSVEPVIKIINW